VILESLPSDQALSGRLAEDADHLVDGFGELLRFAAEHGPPGLAEEARAREGEDRSRVEARLKDWWGDDHRAGEDYLCRALLRPYVEVLARRRVTPDRSRPTGHCPFCGGRPWIAARRAEADAGSGGRRILGCALCGGEWPLGRILCPSCTEGDPEKLPSFQTETYPGVRIEACETCRRYVKSIDLTLDARAIPEVDDLVSLAMDLWATEQGFVRIEPGLAGI
jgi:hypothetical protein